VKVEKAKLVAAYRKHRMDFVYAPARGEDSGTVTVAVCSAVEAANQIFGEDNGQAEEYIWVDVVGWAAEGLALHHEEIASVELLERWLDHVVADLTAAGMTGRLVPRAPLRLPVFYDTLTRHELTAFIAYTVIDPFPPAQAPHLWNVDVGVTRTLAERFGRPPFQGGRIISGNPLQERSPTTAVDALARDLVASWHTVCHLRESPERAVTSAFYVNGSHCFMVHDPHQPWTDRLQTCLQAVLALPHATNLAFVQYANPFSTRWDHMVQGNPALPHPGLAARWRYRPDLIPRYIPDPRGIMLLTDAHLDRADDLTGWEIDSLGHGRHLVMAPDLAAWYAQPEPDPAVLAAARADFGPVILTPEILEANPVPPS
jgi:hypothetical protein